MIGSRGEGSACTVFSMSRVIEFDLIRWDYLFSTITTTATTTTATVRPYPLSSRSNASAQIPAAAAEYRQQWILIAAETSLVK
jgi:hypothetical protein